MENREGPVMILCFENLPNQIHFMSHSTTTIAHQHELVGPNPPQDNREFFQLVKDGNLGYIHFGIL